ncbi:hypothetical protein T05_15446 [Trichinella murrelli]|uniref:Uncharacterized protein n=1 Tax=Trichinella murrelli TaxID=144512 RepID=A0A0V0TPL1_9BILA|nr:hypothetical protein T05_15446 [Trichinella murrelli]
MSSRCQVLIHTVLLACVVRQHNGKIEWMPAPFFLCRLPPESVSIPAPKYKKSHLVMNRVS